MTGKNGRKKIKGVYKAYCQPRHLDYIDWSPQFVSFGKDILFSKKWEVFCIPKGKIFNKKLDKEMIPIKITVEYVKEIEALRTAQKKEGG